MEQVAQVLLVVAMVGLYLAGLSPDKVWSWLPRAVQDELSVLGGILYLPGDDPLMWYRPPR